MSNSVKEPTLKRMSMSLERHSLARLKPKSIRGFLRQYDTYCQELKSRSWQLEDASSVSVEPGRPVGLVFSVDVDQF